jgi:hypothetical protein
MLGYFRDNPKGDDPVALKTMSIDKLVKLKSDVEAMLAVKVTEHRGFRLLIKLRHVHCT